MQVSALSISIKKLALDTGFDLAGIALPDDPTLDEAIQKYSNWIDHGHHQSMDYLKRHLPVKADPKKFFPETRSILCVALVYGENSLESKLFEASLDKALVSVYTRGEDYHEVFREKLEFLAVALSKNFGIRTKPFVDSAPVMDRFWAWRAGLGWLGKNTCLIHRKLGSFLFLGGLFLDCELQADAPTPDHCGRCRKCIDACPTMALSELRFLETEKCIAYHTIENKGEIPASMIPKTGRWIAGCDICQTVCPWNDPPGVPQFLNSGESHFKEKNPAYGESLLSLAQWSVEDFKEKTKHTAMSRMKYGGFARNLAIAIFNSDLKNESKVQALLSLEKQANTLLDTDSRREACLKIVRSLLWEIKNKPLP